MMCSFSNLIMILRQYNIIAIHSKAIRNMAMTHKSHIVASILYSKQTDRVVHTEIHKKHVHILRVEDFNQERYD